VTTEAEVDALIASWEERLRRVDENLIALESEPTYQMLSGRAGEKPSLEGVTQERVLPALLALGPLFEDRARLTEVVDRAKEIRTSVGFWDKEQKLHEIQSLFYGPSIRLAPSHIPLSRRNLLDPASADVVVVPEQLLFAMANAYQVARDAVTEVAEAWARLEPFLEGVERELASLKTTAKDLGDASASPELDWLDAELGRLRSQVARDPLGVAGGVEAVLTPRLRALRSRLTEQHATKGRVATGLDAAAALERECARGHASAKDARARAFTEVFHANLPASVDDTLMAGLSAWREKLEATALAGRFGPADVGLKRWNETARSYLAEDKAVASALEGLLAERTELVGRLSARRAQLEALVAKGTPVDPDLIARGQAAESLLRARPTALADAARAVDAYEAEVVRLAERARRR
jgi:hypothetical protein